MECPMCVGYNTRFVTVGEKEDILYDIWECMDCGDRFTRNERPKLESKGGEPNVKTDVEKKLEEEKT